MPTITVNAEPRSFPDPLTVAGLVRLLRKDPAKLAVEVNRDVVPRAEHAARHLRDGDAVEIVTLVGGGSGRGSGVRNQESGIRNQESETTKTEALSDPCLLTPDSCLKVGKFTFTSRLFTGTGKY